MAAGKKIGRKAQASNDFLEPLAPISVTATDIGTGRAVGNGAATVSFALPALSPAATSYTVTASTGQTATGASSPLTVQGITANASVTFTVRATNAAGTSQASAASSAIAVTTVPTTPVAPTVTTQVNQDNLTFTPPVNGGKAITNYFWASSDGKSGNTASTTVAVTQEGGTAQTYTVRADNANGSSGTSPSSTSITTTPPFFPPFFPFFPPFFPFFPPFFPFFPFFPPFFPFFPPFFPFFPFFPPFFPHFVAAPPYFPGPYFSPRWGSDYRLKDSIEEYDVDNSAEIISEIEIDETDIG